MSKDPALREAVLSWLEHAGGVSPKSQSPGMLMLQPHWEDVVAAAAAAAPRDEHPDLYTLGKGDGTLNQWTLLVESGLAYAAGLIAVGAPLSLAGVADDFVAFCTGPAPVAERWLLLNGTFPLGTRIPLGQYTLQTFTAEELLKSVPMPALHSIQPWSHALDIITGAPFLHLPEPGHRVTRSPDRSDATGPHPEAQHWQALLPLMLWDEELLQVDSVFTVARGRYFDLNHQDVPTRQGQHTGDAETEVRATGDFRVQAADLPALTAFCTTISAKIDAVMVGRTHSRRIPKERAQRLQDAATRLLDAYRRTRHHDSVGETDYGKLLLDYVVCLELLLRSSNDRGGRGISSTLQTRASALFLSPEEQNHVRALTREAYNARSCYAHGRAMKEQTEKEQQEKLQAVRILTQKVILRWLILTPSGPEDLATLLDAAPGPGREEHIHQPLRIFFTTTPPRRRPADIALA